MYDFVDRKLAELDPGSRFLVWSMRLWVAAIGMSQCPSPAVAPAFARWKAAGALPAFLRMMALFNRDALEPFRFCALGCDHVSEHEALVLNLICTMDERRYRVARDTLLLLIAEDSVGAQLETLASLAAALRHADMAPTRPYSTGATSTE